MREFPKRSLTVLFLGLLLLSCVRAPIPAGKGTSAPPPPPAIDVDPNLTTAEVACHEPGLTPIAGGGVVCFVDSECEVHTVDASTGKKLWSFKSEEPSSEPPVIAGAIAYIVGGHRIYALDLRTGRQRWSAETPGSDSSGPSVAGDLALFWNDDGDLYALEQASGRERWRIRAAEDDPCQSVKVVAGAAYCVTSEFLLCLDAATGKERWRYHSAGEWSGEVTMVGGVVCAEDTESIHCLDARTSQLIWKVDTGNDSNLIKAVDGLVYFKNDNRLCALDLRTGEQMWAYLEEHGDKEYVFRGVAGRVAWLEDDGNVYGIDIGTGQKKWQFDGYSFLAAKAGLLVLDRGAYITAVDVRDLHEKWKFTMPADYGALSTPVLERDRLFLVGGDEYLFALDLASGKQSWRYSSRSTAIGSATPAVK